MSYIPFGPEIGAFYTLEGANGVIASFNDPDDPNYCGMLTDVTGLDSADVRDAGDVLPEADGGYQGINYYGRRPITMTGSMFGYDTIAERNAQMAKIRQATNARNSNGVMRFTGQASDAIEMLVKFSRQLPTRFSGAWIKTFNIAIVSNDTPILSNTLTTIPAGAVCNAFNLGDYEHWAPDSITITSYSTGPVTITNTTAGGQIVLNAGLGFFSGHTFQVWPHIHQIFDVTGGTWINATIDYVNSTWFGLAKGNNAITSNNGLISVSYRSAWV